MTTMHTDPREPLRSPSHRGPLASLLSRRLLSSVSLAAASACALALFPAGAGATSAPTPSVAADQVQSSNTLATVSAPITPVSTAQLGAYWTPARMASATNADLISVPRTARTVTRPSMHVVQIDGSAATQPAAGLERSASANAGADTRAPSSVAASSVVSTGVPWTGGMFPRDTVGKVFFNTHDGKPWVCSASIVNSAGKDMVWTAGHCVYGSLGGREPGEQWHTNWVFKPNYFYGAALDGVWTHRHFTIPTSYFTYQDEADDYSAVTMNPDASGVKIANRLGAQGITMGGSYVRQVTDFGYPAEYPYDGYELNYCAGTTFQSGVYVGLKCTMTGGSSGGPWITGFNGSSGQVWAVNAFKYDDDPSTMYSPYLGTEAYDIYESLVNA